MTRNEFAKLISAIRAYYQKADLFQDRAVQELWFDALQDIDYESAKQGLMNHVKTSNFVPTIADIRESVYDANVEDEGWSKGWRDVLTAIRKYGYLNESEALESLDDVAREATRRLGWKEICLTEQDQMQVLRANFRMVYEQIASRKKTGAIMSDNLLAEIGTIKIGNKTMLLGDANGEE